MYKSNKNDYYLKYISGVEWVNLKQSKAMALGSGFDAFIKAELDPVAFNRDELFDKQVDETHRVAIKPHVEELFDQYKKGNALNHLLADFRKSIIPPQFEFGLGGNIDGVPLFGYPDCVFTTETGVSVILDFKVSGFYNMKDEKQPNKQSPKKGYLVEWPAGKGHKDVKYKKHEGIVINEYHNFEDIDVDWATQLCMYAWMAGSRSSFIGCIEQILPGRFCQYRGIASEAFQNKLLEDLKEMWEWVNNVYENNYDCWNQLTLSYLRNN